MNFDFSDDQKLLRDQARKFLGAQATSARVRRILEGDEPYDVDLWRGMVELAWPATAVPEEFGGAGFGALELCVIAEELGRSLAPTPFSSSVYLATEAILAAGSADQKKRWLPKLAAGQAIGCLALAEGPRVVTAARIETTAHGDRLSGLKVPVADGDVADVAVVAARTSRDGEERSVSLFLVDLSGPGGARVPVKTVDPTRSHARIELHQVPAEPLGATGDGWRLLERLLDRAAVLFAFEQVGGAQAADRLVPGDQAQAGGRLHRDGAGAVERVLRRVGALDRRARAPGRRGGRPRQRERGVLPGRQGEHPDPRRHGLHLGVRLPPVLPPGQAARADPGQHACLEGPFDHASGISGERLKGGFA